MLGIEMVRDFMGAVRACGPLRGAQRACGALRACMGCAEGFEVH